MPTKNTTPQTHDNAPQEPEDWEEAEILFRDWLQGKKVPFMRISQLENSEYSDELRSSNTVRPDFFVLIKGIGAIAVDVKLRTVLKDEKFYVSLRERAKLINFEDSFHMNTWCCFIKKRTSPAENEEFYFCRIKDFCDDDLERRELPRGTGIFIEKAKMKMIPATPDGSLKNLLCD